MGKIHDEQMRKSAIFQAKRILLQTLTKIQWVALRLILFGNAEHPCEVREKEKIIEKISKKA